MSRDEQIKNQNKWKNNRDNIVSKTYLPMKPKMEYELLSDVSVSTLWSHLILFSLQ